MMVVVASLFLIDSGQYVPYIMSLAVKRVNFKLQMDAVVVRTASSTLPACICCSCTVACSSVCGPALFSGEVHRQVHVPKASLDCLRHGAMCTRHEYPCLHQDLTVSLGPDGISMSRRIFVMLRQEAVESRNLPQKLVNPIINHLKLKYQFTGLTSHDNLWKELPYAMVCMLLLIAATYRASSRLEIYCSPGRCTPMICHAAYAAAHANDHSHIAGAREASSPDAGTKLTRQHLASGLRPPSCNMLASLCMSIVNSRLCHGSKWRWQRQWQGRSWTS